MRGLDLFAGIGGASIAMQRAGMEVIAHSEIEPFVCRVLEHRFDGIPNLGDVTKIDVDEVKERYGRVDLVSGGFPCQDLSVAGKRGGLRGARSGLFWEIVRLADGLRPTWLVLENVPGIFSSNEGRDFALVLDALCELGYGVSWRVLDAQHFGVPQRRRRVFIVCYLGAPCPPEVLFEPEGVQRDSAPRKETGKETARGSVPSVASTLGVTHGGDDLDRMPMVPDIAHALTTRSGAAEEDGTGRGSPLVPEVSHALTGEGHDASEDGTGRGTPLVPELSAALAGSTRWDAETETFVPVALGFHSTQDPVTLEDGTPRLGQGTKNGYGSMAVAFALRGREEGARVEVSGDAASSIRGTSGGSSRDYVGTGMAVRRLTPTECERLQGFPDGWTDIPGASDSARYRALGNAWAVPVGEWVMRRIARYEKLRTRKR